MTLVAIDGNHNLHRILRVAAFQDMHKNGVFTGGVYGGLSTIRTALDKFHARSCVVVWDAPGAPSRKALWPEYKAHRKTKETEEETEKRRQQFIAQKIILTKILRLLGCRVIERTGAEGDDLLYAVAKLHEGDVVVVSEDMDLAQLVSPSARLWRPRKDEVVELSNFETVTGVPINHFVLKKALVGDSSDNVPGVRGVGEKRATALINESLPALQAGLATFRELCSSHKSAPVRRVHEQFADVERNFHIMDLSLFPWTDDAMGSIRDELASPLQRDRDAARAAFHQLGFEAYLDHFSSWILPFLVLR